MHISARIAHAWPGKSSPSGEHPAIWHMLDVGACAERLIAGHRAFTALSANQRRAFVVLAALHDVGKISATFRGVIRHRRRGTYRHWMLSDVLLTRILDPILEQALGGDIHARGELYAAVSGHHGGPERSNDRREIARRKTAIGTDAEVAARNWTSLLLELLPGGSFEGLDQRAARRLSWALSGLTVAADWVASNTQWFPPASPDLSPAEYLKRARAQAAHAVGKSGLDATPLTAMKDARSLTGLRELRPMQTAAVDSELSDGPALVLLEDATGAGKTEAALILAHRMMASGYARGLFFALPTMATANAMFGRMVDAAARLFADRPSLSLVHGRSHLHSGFRALVGSEDDPTPEAGCARWLADDRRRSLLAEIGVGTIDQALMGVLPTRFSTLRLFGITDRILIVDEAHAYDPYMQRQLETLLKMQAMNGGSAIVMTATLPLEMRQRYADAFRSGLGCQAAALDHRDYPALAIVGAGSRAEAVAPAPATCRSVGVERIDSADEAVEVLAANSGNGAACVWVRNAVDDAIAAVHALRARGCSTHLLHARFTLGDRLQHEEAVMDRFGRVGDQRAGQVLVATQVVEASLDLDFDVMVSDLAPIGALIQRAGRLWRHMDRRPECARPVPGPSLTILSPDPDDVADESWLNDVLDRGAFDYGHDDQWLTARAVFDAGAIRAPEGLRALIEAVHGPSAPQVPEPLIPAQMEHEGTDIGDAAHAQQNVVSPEDGYLKGTKGGVWSDEQFPTRLGEEEATLVLARREPDGLHPWWSDEEEPARAWTLSEVRCHRRRLPAELPDQSTEDIARLKATWSRGKREFLIVCPVSENGVICAGLRYDRQWGLTFS
ncbi:MAG: CRISPR-associated helicase Cas3' [Alphaproteobacteria bacterium]|nr:CRISPR-associated helicase Cas3' [Alphaproteobacteria bacterium]